MSLRSSFPLVGLLLFVLAPAACGPEAHSVRLKLIDPAPGQTGASLTAELVVTGRAEESFLTVVASDGKPFPPRKTDCSRPSCTLKLDLPSGSYQVQGVMVPEAEDGSNLADMTTEVASITIDARPLTSSLLPSPGDGEIKVLFERDVLPSSTTPDNIKVTRTLQTDFGAKSNVTEPVTVATALDGRTLTIKGDFRGPALLDVKLDAVRDVPGNHNLVTYRVPRRYFTDGPDLRPYFNVGAPDRLRRDAQGRVHHLSQKGVWRLDGAEWVPTATWTHDYEQDFDIDAQGTPFVAFTTLRESVHPVLGTSQQERQLHVERWNGATMEPVGGALATSVNLPFELAMRVDPQGRPVLLVGPTELGATSLQLLRWSGTAWTTLSAKLNGAPSSRLLGIGGGDRGPVVVGWLEGSAPQWRRVEEGGALVAIDVAGAPGVPQLPSLTYGPAGEMLAAAVLPGNNAEPLGVVRRSSAGRWELLSGAGEARREAVLSLTTDLAGAPVILTQRRDEAGAIKNDPGDPNSSFTPVVYTTMSGYRHDGQRWTPLEGATHELLETQQAPWMAEVPADFSIGDKTAGIGSAFAQDGSLRILKLRSRTDFSGNHPTARTFILRSAHFR